MLEWLFILGLCFFLFSATCVVMLFWYAMLISFWNGR
jgi:hypothetical protein